jgi:hypothetical protein
MRDDFACLARKDNRGSVVWQTRIKPRMNADEALISEGSSSYPRFICVHPRLNSSGDADDSRALWRGAPAVSCAAHD